MCQFIDLPVPLVHGSLQVPNMLDRASFEVKPAILESGDDGNGESDTTQREQDASCIRGCYPALFRLLDVIGGNTNLRPVLANATIHEVLGLIEPENILDSQMGIQG